MYPLLGGSVGLPVSSYSALLVAAVLFGLWHGPRICERRERLDWLTTRRALIVIGLAAFVGGRLQFVLGHVEQIAARPGAAIDPRTAGFHAIGAVAAVAIVLPLAARWTGLPLGKLADGLTPTVGLGVALARLGCFLRGCCFGTVCARPWCLRFPEGSAAFRLHARLGWLEAGARASLPVHPLELYFAGAGLALAGLASALRGRKRYDGQIGLLGLVWLCGTTAALEPLRAPLEPVTSFGTSRLQLVALVAFATSIVLAAAIELPRRRGARLSAFR